MNTRIEWDAKAAAAETASLGNKLLATVVPLYNELVGIVERHQAATDLDGSIDSFIESSDDTEIVTLRKQVEQAKKLIEKNTAAMSERARVALMEQIDPNFDEAKSKAKYNDVKAELKKNGGTVRDTFKLLGKVTSELSPAGRESNFKGADSEGELLLAALDIPKLEKGATEQSATDPAVKEFNKNAKEWGRANGFKVADKGALSTEVKEAYAKATGTVIP